MKRNWIKGLDRLAILLAIPFSILGGYYSSKAITEHQSVWVYLTIEEEEDLIAKTKPNRFMEMFGYGHETKIFGKSRKNGVIANGKKELTDLQKNHPMAMAALNRALLEGGDPNGSLVQNIAFGLKYNYNNELSLIPSTSKRYLAGIIGSLCTTLTFIFGIGLLTRGIPKIIQWVKNGFSYKDSE